MSDLDLRDHLERTMAEVRPPAGLHERALLEGRRLRRRRRAGAAAGGLIAVAATTVVAALVLGGHDGPRDPGFADDPTPTPTGETSASPEAPAVPQGWWSTPARRMLAQVEDLLPPGVTVTDADLTADGLDGPVRAVGSLSGVLDADTGPGAFQVLLYPPETPAALPESRVTTDESGNQVTEVYAVAEPFTERVQCRQYMTTCEALVDDDGTPVGRVATTTEQGTTYHDVFVLGPDGGALYAYVGDSTGEKPGYEEPSATEPPLTPDELVDLVRDPVWTSYVATDRAE